MLDEGIAAGFDALGIDYRTVAYVERDAYAAAALVARMASAALDQALVWDDLTTFDGRALRGLVDCVSAGFPCQDLSVAGKRAGLDGKRSGLFFEVLRIADDCDAQCLVLENVGGIATATAAFVDEAGAQWDERAAARVLGELADRGWNAEWLTLRASDVGAAHGRERWFCFAWRMADPERRTGERRREQRIVGGTPRSTEGEAHQRQRIRHAADTSGNALANSNGQQLRSNGREPVTSPDRRHDAEGRGASMADAEGIGRGEGRSEHERQQGRRAITEHGSALGNACGTDLARGGATP